MSKKSEGGLLESQAEGLLKRLNDDRTERCQTIEQAAAARAREVVHTAYAENRERLHRVAEELRRTRHQQALTARAREQSRQRERRQAAEREMLVRGWARLEAILQQHWADTERRANWVQAVLQQAQAELPRCAWSVGYPEGWIETERQALDAAIQRHCGEPPRWQPDPALTAGLWIGAEGLFLDGSTGKSEHGLLAGRQQLEARLLHHMERLMRENGA